MLGEWYVCEILCLGHRVHTLRTIHWLHGLLSLAVVECRGRILLRADGALRLESPTMFK